MLRGVAVAWGWRLGWRWVWGLGLGWSVRGVAVVERVAVAQGVWV